ncbi:MAG TPA: N-acetylmuramoyl-L-alanine amidase, partial [Elusimicrobiota bacterium]|nr:N-acetylmuramoyl-L-alanine amidase [Elusimicrobiota bacterium]
PPLGSTGPISFVSPLEGLELSADHDFVLGSVVDPKALFTINGVTVTVHKDGGFLAWLPISAGTFTFHARLDLASGPVAAERSIDVPLPPKPVPDGALAIDASSLEPREDLELRAGDWWTARMKASRGRSARVRVGSGPWREMRETDPRLGVYEAALQAQPGESFGPAPVEYEIGSAWSSVRLKGQALVSASDSPPAVAVVKPTANGFVSLKIGPGEGFLVFPPAGTRFLETGRRGSSVRLALSPELSGWLDAKDVETSTGAAPPSAVSDNIGVTVDADKAVVRVPLSDRVPFTVDEDASLGKLTLRLYWTHGHTNWINYEGRDEFVREASWRQESSDVMAVDVDLRPGERLWGWHAGWSGDSLRLTLFRPPRVNPSRPLAGLRIMLDPGHTSDPRDGATGPLGTREPTANFAIAQAVAARLRREGAVPLLTRASLTDDVPLAARPELAVERGANLYVSIHNNALPDGSDPLSAPHGFMVFYYHPHSLDLARALHASYVKEVPLTDEGLKWGNILVTRLTDMPAVLVESTMMILPEQEAMLNEPAFRDRLAKAIVDGLRSFARGTARRQ